MLLVGIAAALILLAIRPASPHLAGAVLAGVESVDFAKAVLGYLLAFLLFAGAMQVDLAELRRRLLAVASLATAGVVVSTFIVGSGLFLAARALGIALTLPWALVFGALISPTDPIAVLATVKRRRLSEALQVVLQGEALLNDGVGIVIFSALLAYAAGSAPNLSHAVLSVIAQSAGGLALGAAAGFLTLAALRAVDDSTVAVSLSLALAMGIYAGARALDVSGPIAVVGAGFSVGSGVGGVRPSDAFLRSFWRLVDEILNALLFLLLGLQVIAVRFEWSWAPLCLIALGLVLAARLIVVLPWGAYFRLREEKRGAGVLLAWGGLHGALSLALALSIPAVAARPLLLEATFIVATLSVAIQGLTFPALVRAIHGRASPAPSPEP